MLIAALGHAGLKVETIDAAVLIDPWLSPEGAFQASWFQYPANEHLIRPELFRPALIAISHEHLDHLDPWFLAQVSADVPILIPRYPSPVLAQKILATGAHKIVEVAPWERFEVSPTVTVFFVSEPSPMNYDSAVVVTSAGQSLLDLNDARLAPVQLRGIRQAVGGTVDVFAVQGAGASWFPLCYEYPQGHKRELSRQKRYAKFGYVRRAIRVLEPGITLPIGGPPCFLDPELMIYNSEMGRDGIFPDQEQVAAWLKEGRNQAVAVLLPGDAWDISAREQVRDGFWRAFSFKDREEYLRDYAGMRAATIAEVRGRYQQPRSSLWRAFKTYFEKALELSDYFNRRIAMKVGFDVTGPAGGAWSVDFRDGRRAVCDEKGADCEYVYRIADRWVQPILDGRVLWEDFLLSLRFSAYRDPDIYNDHLLGLLKFADVQALAEVERFETSMETSERITIEADGNLYSIGRRCPHAGNDLLETGEILPGGRLRCLAHHYEFSLATGQCLTSVCPPLSIRRLNR